MKPPRLPVEHPDRLLELEEHLESTLNFLMDDAVAAGWEVDEAQKAVRSIADIFRARHEANLDTERQISEARKKQAH